MQEQFLCGCEAGVDRAGISNRPDARSGCAATCDTEGSCLPCPALSGHALIAIKFGHCHY